MLIKSGLHGKFIFKTSCTVTIFNKARQKLRILATIQRSITTREWSLHLGQGWVTYGPRNVLCGTPPSSLFRKFF